MKKDPEADFDETVKSVSEDYNALEGTFDTNEKKEDKEEGEEDLTSSGYPEEVISVLRTLKDGEFAPDVIETDTAFYVVRPVSYTHLFRAFSMSSDYFRGRAQRKADL